MSGNEKFPSPSVMMSRCKSGTPNTSMRNSVNGPTNANRVERITSDASGGGRTDRAVTGVPGMLATGGALFAHPARSAAVAAHKRIFFIGKLSNPVIDGGEGYNGDRKSTRLNSSH